MNPIVNNTFIPVESRIGEVVFLDILKNPIGIGDLRRNSI